MELLWMKMVDGATMRFNMPLFLHVKSLSA